jgi:murein DD-endopeptidase MepM/ murein hydrolase activator NlpD
MWRIARQYGLAPEQLARCNGIADPRRIRAGETLLIPFNAPPPAVEPAAGSPPPSGPLPYDSGPPVPADDIGLGVIEDGFVEVDGEDEPDPWEYGAPRPRVEPTPAGQPSSPFLWPLTGAVSSTFGIRGGRMHRGVDLTAAEGSSIRASRDGIVAYSGRGFRGYGNLVILDHGDGFLTAYAHNRKNLVRLNEAVRAGDTVAIVGHTGNATAAHVHFEIRMGEKAVDPLSYLPSLVAASAPPGPASADTSASAR